MRDRHLGGGPTRLIFVPGLMGSMLQSEGLGGVWWIDVRSRNHLNDLRLSPDGLHDANADHRIAPCTTDPIYEPFLVAMLARDDFGPLTFLYDWRKPLAASVDRLKELVERTWQSSGQKVHIVAHSMGGLVVRATLAKQRCALAKARRIGFIATTHDGSPAIARHLKNHFWGFSSSRCRPLDLAPNVPLAMGCVELASCAPGNLPRYPPRRCSALDI